MANYYALARSNYFKVNERNRQCPQCKIAKRLVVRVKGCVLFQYVQQMDGSNKSEYAN